MPYHNPYQKKILRSPLHYLLWQFGYYNDREPPKPIPHDFQFPLPQSTVKNPKGLVRWVNHSTFLIEIFGLTFLTDPIFSDRCSPFSFFGPKRHHSPIPAFDELPHIDVTIISHNHYDHLDKKSVERLINRFPQLIWIVPKGLKGWFLKRPGVDSKKIFELGWYGSVELKVGEVKMTFTSTPAQHFSGRGLFDHNQSLWMGCVTEIEDPNQGKKKFYFAGDTGYNEYDFKRIGEKFEKIDLSMIPIGTYLPRRFMKAVHINPKEALLIHQEVRSNLSIGSHWGTFNLGGEPIGRPPFDLFEALKEHQSTDEFCVLPPGHILNW